MHGDLGCNSRLKRGPVASLHGLQKPPASLPSPAWGEGPQARLVNWKKMKPRPAPALAA